MVVMSSGIALRPWSLVRGDGQVLMTGSDLNELLEICEAFNVRRASKIVELKHPSRRAS